MADDWNRRSVLMSWAISLTKRWNGNFLISSSVDFWYRLISRKATVPWSVPMRFLHSSNCRGSFLCTNCSSTACSWSSPGARFPSRSQIRPLSSLNFLEHSTRQGWDGYIFVVDMIILQNIIANVELIPSQPISLHSAKL